MTVALLEQVAITCRSTWSYIVTSTIVVLLKSCSKGTMPWYDYPQTSSYCAHVLPKFLSYPYVYPYVYPYRAELAYQHTSIRLLRMHACNCNYYCVCIDLDNENVVAIKITTH